MKLHYKFCAWALAIAINIGTAGSTVSAQTSDKPQHVVSLDELEQQTGRPAESRQENEAAIRHLLSSEAGQSALKSANVDYQRVDTAIGQLDDAELAKLADRSRQAENDFAAGFISPKHLAYIILALVVIIVIIVLV